ncbi:MAG: hypothetical protein H6742_16230 [Alphaproteobacteria bacterium]|nr:hypothetical protein [Alphaproteobacteria bacterium]
MKPVPATPAEAPDAGPAAELDPWALALDRGRAWLQRVRNADGSWGYTPGQQGRPEPTVLAAAAGQDDAWVAVDWLGSHDQDYAAFLLPAVAWLRAPELAGRALDTLLAFHAVTTESEHAFDTTLPGWAWKEGTTPWVEPTAFAMLGLRRALPDLTGPLAEQARTRLAQGSAYLADRQGHDGGWNYGNPRVFGAELDSHLDATGWALMACDSGPMAERGFDFLRGILDRPSTMGLSLGALASAVHGRDPRPYLDLLAPRVTDDGCRGRADLTALACAALTLGKEHHHAFRA